MFDLDSSSLNRSRWLLDGIAVVDIYAAWYMLLSINPNLPKVDPILAKIYFSEYGVNTDGLSDTAVMTIRPQDPGLLPEVHRPAPGRHHREVREDML
jgi:hypothetical protein